MGATATEPGRRSHWPLLGVLIVVLLYDAALLTMRRLALNDDGVLLYYPAAATLADALARGTLPFWTPLLQAGFPLLADGQPGALYPFNLAAFAWLPTAVAFNSIIVLHQLLVALFTYYWGRVLQVSSVAGALMALLAALMTPLSGNALAINEALVWVPLLFAIVERCLQQKSAAAAWPIAPLVALQWLAGAPQIAAYAVVTIATYVAARSLGDNWRWRQRGVVIAAIGGAILLGMALAAPQILATYELSGFSLRAGGVPAGLAGERSLLPLGLITFVAPSWLHFFAAAGLGEGAYIGVIPLLLALAALAVRPRPRWVLPMLAVAGLTALLACGRYGPLFPLVRHLPVLAYFRFPSRFLLLTQFPLFALFAVGWDSIVAMSLPRATHVFRRLLFAAAILLIGNCLVAVPLVGLHRQILSWGAAFVERYVLSNPFHVQPPAYYDAKIEALYAALLRAVMLPGRLVWVPLALTLTVWLWWRRDRLATPWRAALVALMIVADAVVFAGGMREGMAPAVVTAWQPTAQQLHQAAGGKDCRFLPVIDARVAAKRTRNLDLLPANYNLVAGISSASMYSPLGFDAYARLMAPLGGVDLAYGYRPKTPTDIEKNRALLNLLNICQLTSREPLTGFTELGRSNGVALYRNDEAHARAFVTDQVHTVASVDAAITWMHQHPERLHDTAVLERALDSPLDAHTAAASVVRIVDDQAQRVRLEVNAAGAVLLVLIDSYYPGWQARIDGAPASLYRADAAFRAVPVPTGTHVVEFEYVPRAFWQGVKMAAVAAALLGLWIVGAFVTARPTETRST